MEKNTIDIKVFLKDLNEAWVPGDPNKEWNFATEAELNDWLQFVNFNKIIDDHLKDLEIMFLELQDLNSNETQTMVKLRDSMRNAWITVRSFGIKVNKLDSKNLKRIKFFEAYFGDDFITKTRSKNK